MRFVKILLLASVTLLGGQRYAVSAPPLSRCQCNYDKWVGTCSATISNQKSWARITSNTQQCSRVDWYIDGNPQMTIVTNGLETEPLLNVKPDSKLVIQSCNVCQDAMMPDGPQPTQSGGNTQTDASQVKSGFAGDWTGTERNIFGFGHTFNVTLSVRGSVVTGTWAGDQGTSAISGTVNGSIATLSLSGPGAKNSKFELIDPNTIKYSFGFGSGILKRAQ